jgi:antitoxin component YwqK of YwqJK toxin-antitoxin module
MRLFLPLIIFIIAITACTPRNEVSQNIKGADSLENKSQKDGEYPVYDKNNKLQYMVHYKNGKPNGRVRQFYPDGTVFMEAEFKDGHRNGKCTYFYKNGKTAQVLNYINGEKDGTETQYYQSGTVESINTYKNGVLQPGLKEFYTDGTVAGKDVKLQFKEVDHTTLEGKYFLYITLSDPSLKVNFYSLSANDPKYRKKIKQNGNTGVLEYNISSSESMIKKLLIEAVFYTSKGNKMKVSQAYNLAIN